MCRFRTLRAVIYTRVSVDRAEGRSVEEQETESRRFCDERDWTVVEVVSDSVGASRHSKGTRSGWKRIAKLLEAGDVDILVTWEASRAQRDLAAYAELRDLCVRTGTLWCYSGRVHDLSTADDRFRTGIDALMAEKEADEIAERVQRAMRANAASGRPHGRRLFGFQRTYDPTTGKLTGQIPDPDEAPIVRRIFAEYLAGDGVRVIGNRLNADGIPTPGGVEWNDTQVRRVLTNPAYAGRRVHRGEVVGDAAWLPLVSPEDFDRTQALLVQRRTYSRRADPRARLLTGVARCGLCGAKLYVGHDRKVRKVYTCRAFFHVSRDERQLDDYISRLVVGRLEQIDATALSNPPPDGETEAARQRVAELRARLEDATSQFTAGRLTGATLARIEADLLPEIADAEARLRRQVVPLGFDLPTEDVGEWWADLELPKRREVVGTVLAMVVVHPTVRGRRTFDPDAVEVHWRS